MDFGRNAYNRYSRCQNVLDDHSAGSDTDIVCDADAAKDLGSLADIDVVTNDWGVIGIAARTADATVPVDNTVLPDPRFGIDNDGPIMFQS